MKRAAHPPGPAAAAGGRQARRPLPVLLDIVIPVFGEALALPTFHRKLIDVIDRPGIRWRAIYVDDGSGDETPRPCCGPCARPTLGWLGFA